MAVCNSGKSKLTVVLSILGVIVVILVIAALIRGSEPKGDYKGRVFVAGHGGHIADANVVIDPSDTVNPIKIPSYAVWSGDKLHMIPLGESRDHAFHDIRIDSENPNTIFWSTYFAKKPSVIVGKADLRTNKWVAEKTYQLPKEVIDFGKTTKSTLYCGSGQSVKYYLPVFMGYPGFIDVVEKGTLELKHRVMFASNPELPTNYTFTHGNNSPDMKYMYIVMGESNPAHAVKGLTWKIHFILLDMAALIDNGELKIVKRNSADFPAGTITFRATYTHDGSKILQSGRTRAIVLDANTLEVLQHKEYPIEGDEVHDVIATPDDKYGIATLRAKIDQDGKKVMDGQIALYDIANNNWIGNATSTCKHCHNKWQKGGPLGLGLRVVGCTRCHQDQRNAIHVVGDNVLCGADELLVKK